MVAFPGDVALGIASLITGGVIERHPKLRIGFSHGGGGFAMVLPRLEHGWKTFPAVKDTLPHPPSTYAKKLYYDTLVYDPLALRYIVERFGLSQIMIGTDYPFGISETDPHGAVAAAGLGAQAEKMLREDNARRYLGMQAA